MYLLYGLSEDVVDIVSHERFLETLLARRIYTLADNSRLIDSYAVDRRAGNADTLYRADISLRACKCFGNGFYMFGSRTAAAAEYGNTCLGKLYSACGKSFGVNVIFVGNRVGKSCIRLCDYGESCERAYPFQYGIKLLRAQRAVDTYSVCTQTFQHSDHTFGGNACESTHILLKSHGHQYGLAGIFLSRQHSRFDFVKVGHGLYNDDVSLFACIYKFLVDVVGFLEFKSAGRFKKLTDRAQIKSHKSISCGGFFSVAYACGDYLLNGMAAFCKLVSVCTECVGIDYISTAFHVHTVDTHDSFGIGEIEHFGNVLGLYAVSLEHGSHAAVKVYEVFAFQQRSKSVIHNYLTFLFSSIRYSFVRQMFRNIRTLDGRSFTILCRRAKADRLSRRE